MPRNASGEYVPLTGRHCVGCGKNTVTIAQQDKGIVSINCSSCGRNRVIQRTICPKSGKCKFIIGTAIKG